MQSRKRRILFALGVFIFLLFIIEGGARLYRLSHPQAFIRQFHGTYMFPDEQLLWKMLPGHYFQNGVDIRINSLGMRGAELNQPKKKDCWRILFLGDSSVYGDGVFEQDAFPYLTGKLIQKSENRAVEVANGALPGYSSTQCLHFFENYQKKIMPDAVVVATIWSDAMGRAMTDEELYERFARLGYRFSEKSRSLFRRSDFFLLLENVIESHKSLPESHIIDWTSIVLGDHTSENSRVPVEKHASNLQTIGKSCLDQGIEIYYLILPYEKDLLGTVPPKIISYRNNFARIAKELDAGLVDMPDVFKTLPTADIPKLFIDGLHPTAGGHALIAEALSNFIVHRHVEKKEKAIN